MNLPDFFEASKLKPINYYGHRSIVTDKFFELDAITGEQRQEYAAVIRRFNDLKIKCMGMDLNIASKYESWSIMVKDKWDNKIVIECETEQGGRIFVGYYDCKYTIGLGRTGDGWIKPYPYGDRDPFRTSL